ncbi:MAG: hypothetical protein KDD37_04750 [Bdellovibrionales bacterium]|nr:hypothetical protein [Bdellovibrionales bacterium]
MKQFIVATSICLAYLLLNTSAYGSEVGAKSNRAFPAKYGGFIATWDGRVVIFPNHIKDSLYKWDAFALRYEAIKTNDKGEPNLLDPSVYSPLVTLDGDFPIDSPNNKLNALNRMHLAVAPDTDFKLNPYPSDEKGKPVSNLNSIYKTYRLYIIGTAGSLKSYQPNKPIPDLLVQSTAEIITKNGGTKTAEIVSAKILAEGKPVKSSIDSEPFFGFEPTLSNDGRLVLWGGHPINGGIHFIMYSFNPTPKNNLTWSKPRHLTSMYWVHGAGSANEPVIDGVKFSDRYPIAKQQLRDAYGNYFAAEDGYPGAYPWLSLDNSDLFCPTVATFFAARRSAFSVIGASTNYASRNIDGAVNLTRANVTGRADVWEATPEGKELSEKYNKMTDENGRPFGTNGFQRIMIAPLMQIPSMWTPFTESTERYQLPFTNKKNTYGFLMSHSNRYVEVSLPEISDKDFVLNLPMNEAIEFDKKYLKKMAESRDVKSWNDVYNMARYDPQSTPDLSGLFQTGKLSAGAEFPYEYNDAVKKWRESRVLVDRAVGIEGNSVYFRPKSYITVATKELALEKIRQSKEMNISFFLRKYSTLDNESILQWEKFISVETDENKLVIKNYQYGNWIVVAEPKIHIAPNKWYHYSLNVSANKISLFINGENVSETKISLVIPSIAKNIWIGPFSSQAPSRAAVYSLDQVSISRVVRSENEIRDFALIDTDNRIKNVEQTNEKQIDLGDKLFHDPILSSNQMISCATCHVPNNHFVDSLPIATGVEGKQGTRNTPTVFNIARMSRLMWDGRVNSLEEQALMPIQNPNEMNLPLEEAIKRVKEKYLVEFKEAFNQEPTPDNLGLALKAFQASIKSPPTKFDTREFTEEEIMGFGIFSGKGRCTTCHKGPLLTDQDFHNIGLLKNSSLSDNGRQDVTNRVSDYFKFRTPSLRFVSKTAPYFHDGRVNNLKEVILFYNKGGDIKDVNNELVPLGLSESEQRALEAFLETL